MLLKQHIVGKPVLVYRKSDCMLCGGFGQNLATIPKRSIRQLRFFHLISLPYKETDLVPNE